MTRTEVDFKEVFSKGLYKPTRNMKFIQEFVDSNEVCSKVCNYTHKSAHHCAGTLMNTIKRMNLANKIECRVRDGVPYLIKVDKIKK